jgi:hypothetical protein
MTMLTTPEQIDTFRLMSMRSMVKLEALGMKRRGRSATVIAKEYLGLPKSTKREEVVAKLTEQIELAKELMAA